MNDLDFDAASGLLARGDVHKPLRGIPRLIFERLAAERGARGGFGYVQFSDLRRSIDSLDGEADLCAGIKRLRELLIPLDCGIVFVEGRGYRLNVLPATGRADRPLPDVAQRVRDYGVRIADIADYAADEAQRATASTERFTAKIEELMQRASRGAAAFARELSGGAL